DRERERVPDRETALERALEDKERRRIRARASREHSWFGLGMLGLVGWAFAIPMLAVVAVGIWLDTAYESAYSWSLMGVFVGAAIGGLNAWYWVRNEERKIEEDEKDES
ncbi:MAG TPA: AtpZ/AtpI family protein, partial [Spirochaetia bacterium]|nr:AtpZ/AtpI family protein [Spirochaetia bacterium]